MTTSTMDALAEIEKTANSQMVGVALKAFLALSPGGRRAMDAMASEQEHALAMKVIVRSALKAYERILDARQKQPTSATLDTEEAIEEEAIRLCRA